MFCKKCGANLNEGARFCPNCGEPTGSAAGVNAENDANVINITNDTNDTNDLAVTNDIVPADNVTAGGGGEKQMMPPVSDLWNMYSQDGSSANAQASNAQTAGPQYGSTQSPVFTQGFTMEGGFKKFITGHKALLIAGAVVIIVLVLVLSNMTVLANFLRRTFSSPEDYYHYVEKKTVEDISADAGEVYGRYFLDNLNVYDKSVSTKMNVTIGEGGQDLIGLAGLAGVDLSWLESVSITMDSSMKKETIFMGLGAAINGVDILTGNIVYEVDGEAVYLQIPELNEKFMGMEMPGYALRDMEDIWEMYEAFERVCPDQKEVEQMINRYMLTVVECMDDVAKEKGVLEAADVEQKCTVLTVTADANTFKDMTMEILKQMREDEDIEKIIKAAMEEEIIIEGLYLDDMSPEEAYEEFLDWIDDGLEFMEDYGELEVYDDEVLEMKVYVDRKGKIVGRTMEMGDVTIHMLMPEDGKQFGYELSYEDSYFDDPILDETMALTGSGKRSGDKIDGDFVLEYCDTPMMEIGVQELNLKDMRIGLLNGSMTLGLTEDAADYMDYTPGAAMIQGMEISMDWQSDKSSSNCNMGISLRDQNLVNMEISYKQEKGYKGANPGKNVVMVDDMDDLMEWGESLDIGGLTSALKEADVPSEFTDSLEYFEDMDIDSLLRMMYFYY